MKRHEQLTIAGLASAGLVLCGASMAAAAPATLTDGQLDGVTAGAVTVTSIADSGALGALTIAGTTTNTFAIGVAMTGNPGLGVSAGVADGTAVAVGTNLGVGTGPTSASTNVQTAGTASGNFQVNNTVNYTVQGAGGVQFQAGWTFVYGAWLGV